MWRPGERRADDCKFVFCPSRGPDFRKRAGDISPPGEVLSRDGKYPKIPGSADPDPKRTFGKRSKFVRRGHELGAAVSSARCRSHLSNSRFPSFPPRASRMPCLSGSGCFVPRTMLGPTPHRAMTRINNAPSSVIAYGDATFPPVWGRLCVRPKAWGRSPREPKCNPASAPARGMPHP